MPGPRTMTEARRLLDLERQTWEALSGRNPAGALSPLLASDVVMLFPGGMMLHGKAACLAPLNDAPAWETYDIERPSVVGLTSDSGVAVYQVRARRPGQEPYTALVGSSWVRRRGNWQLACHQQTPT
jgi:Domain of unknown function (DUF4440)